MSAADPEKRLIRLEGEFTGWRFTMMAISITLIAAVAFLGVQTTRIDAKLDRLDDRMRSGFAELRAEIANQGQQLRGELTAQTSAIANSITAARSVTQPPPQIIILPAPEPPK
jgi:hypothetical protein